MNRESLRAAQQPLKDRYKDEPAAVARRTALDRLREICMSFPEVTERLSHGSPTWFIRGKKTFVTHVDDHHGDGIVGIWCAAPPGAQEDLVREEPARFFRPPYVGHRGWLGVRLDRSPDWAEVAAILEDAYRQVAPKSLIRLLEGTDE